ncbi:hypothetical protein MPLSOD_100273 [Mesorhizobium sp. SOD10]|nr:hypothetical protein MPLSOD_100273 [Mesorhizobium sp. SOD10]
MPNPSIGREVLSISKVAVANPKPLGVIAQATEGARRKYRGERLQSKAGACGRPDRTL